MVRNAIAVGLALVAAAAPAGVVLRPGESVTVTIADGGDWSAANPVARPADPALGAVAALLQSNSGPNESYQAVQGASPIAVQPGVIRFTFGQQAGTMLLIAENGRERPLVYTARIRKEGEAVPTSICPAPAGKFAVETWDAPLDSIELDGFALPESTPPLWLGCK